MLAGHRAPIKVQNVAWGEQHAWGVSGQVWDVGTKGSFGHLGEGFLRRGAAPREAWSPKLEKLDREVLKTLYEDSTVEYLIPYDKMPKAKNTHFVFISHSYNSSCIKHTHALPFSDSNTPGIHQSFKWCVFLNVILWKAFVNQVLYSEIVGGRNVFFSSGRKCGRSFFMCTA